MGYDNKQRGTNVSEESAASIFKEEEEVGSFKTMVPIYQTKWHHNSEDLNLNIRICENLKFQ
jgi:hypothetical protein